MSAFHRAGLSATCFCIGWSASIQGLGFSAASSSGSRSTDDRRSLVGNALHTALEVNDFLAAASALIERSLPPWIGAGQAQERAIWQPRIKRIDPKMPATPAWSIAFDGDGAAWPNVIANHPLTAALTIPSQTTTSAATTSPMRPVKLIAKTSGSQRGEPAGLAFLVGGGCGCRSFPAVTMRSG